MYPQGVNTFGDFGMPGMVTSTPAYGGGFYQDASGNLQPLTSQAAPAASGMDGMDPQSQQMVQVGSSCLPLYLPCRFAAALAHAHMPWQDGYVGKTRSTPFAEQVNLHCNVTLIPI